MLAAVSESYGMHSTALDIAVVWEKSNELYYSSGRKDERLKIPASRHTGADS